MIQFQLDLLLNRIHARFAGTVVLGPTAANAPSVASQPRVPPRRRLGF